MSQQMNVNIRLEETTAAKCSKCGCELFKEAMLIRKASRFITQTAQDALVPIPVFVCNSCGEILKETLPVQLRTDEAEIID